MICKSCYPCRVIIPDCLETLKIKTSVISSDVIIVITDKFSNTYTVDLTTDTDGIASIDFTDEELEWPEQLLNPYAGDFIVQVYEGPADDDLVPFIIGGVEYDCITISVEDLNPKKDEHTISL